jgi:hypothetical protein
MLRIIGWVLGTLAGLTFVEVGVAILAALSFFGGGTEFQWYIWNEVLLSAKTLRLFWVMIGLLFMLGGAFLAFYSILGIAFKREEGHGL